MRERKRPAVKSWPDIAEVITPQKFYDAAIRYLQRHASSVENLRKVLERRVTRWEIRTKQKAPDAAASWIDDVVQKCAALGFVDDACYAEQTINSLRRQGRSRSYIMQKMQMKGIAKDMVQRFLPPDDEVELTAARRHVARKRLGQSDDPEQRQKDLAKLLRAGFSFDVAKKALLSREN